MGHVGTTLRDRRDNGRSPPNLRCVLFDVRTVDHGNWQVVRVVGDVDLASIPTLRACLDKADGQQVALELGGVDLFDPMGFGLVLGAAMRAARRRSRFVVVCPPGRPRELFTESRVDQIITVVDGLSDLAELDATPPRPVL